MRLWERICKTLGEDLWGFMKIRELWKRICDTLGEDLGVFTRLLERICEDS